MNLLIALTFIEFLDKHAEGLGILVGFMIFFYFIVRSA